MSGTVHVVDDEKSARAAIIRPLSLSGYRVRAYQTGQALLDSLPADDSGPACIVLHMHELGGLDVLKELSARDHPPVIMVSARGDVAASVAAMKRGAVDVLEEPVNATQLRSVVCEALEEHAADQAARLSYAEDRARIESLTRREQEVLRYIISGRLNKVIASELTISEKTVKVHRARVLEKMQVRSVAELSRICTLNGVDPAQQTTDRPAPLAVANRLRLIA